jgi:NADPH-dependent ferric siderophore reductase
METNTNEPIKKAPVYMYAQVITICDKTPHLRCITLSHKDLKDIGPVAAGSHLKIMISKDIFSLPELPHLNNGRPAWQDENKKPYIRTYTIRRLDTTKGIIDIEFVLHGDNGPASAWASQAKIGDYLGLGIKSGKRGTNADWYLFAGDDTALPAIAAKIEALPADAKGIALLEVNSESDCFAINSPQHIIIKWLFRNGIPPERSTLLMDHFLTVVIPDTTAIVRYIWVAGESGVVSNIRDYAKQHLSLSHSELHATSYWKAGYSEED